MMAKSKKKGLFTEKDKQGLADKKGLEMGTLFTEKDRQKGLADKKGLDMGRLHTDKDKEGLL